MTNTHKHTREHHRGMCEVIKKNCSCYTTDYTVIFITHSVDALSFFVLFLHSLLADKTQGEKKINAKHNNGCKSDDNGVINNVF